MGLPLVGGGAVSGSQFSSPSVDASFCAGALREQEIIWAGTVAAAPLAATRIGRPGGKGSEGLICMILLPHRAAHIAVRATRLDTGES